MRNILTSAQIINVQNGSINADKLQGVQYNHIHAQRSVNESVQQAVAKTKDYFVAEATKFVKYRDYEALGKALHPIMDAYAPAHQGFSIFDDTFNTWKSHWEETFGFYMILWTHDQLNNASDASRLIFNTLSTLPADIPTGKVDAIFASWYNACSK